MGNIIQINAFEAIPFSLSRSLLESARKFPLCGFKFWKDGAEFYDLIGKHWLLLFALSLAKESFGALCCLKKTEKSIDAYLLSQCRFVGSFYPKKINTSRPVTNVNVTKSTIESINKLAKRRRWTFLKSVPNFTSRCLSHESWITIRKGNMMGLSKFSRGVGGEDYLWWLQNVLIKWRLCVEKSKSWIFGAKCFDGVSQDLIVGTRFWGLRSLDFVTSLGNDLI